jgi:hypothetical protein
MWWNAKEINKTYIQCIKPPTHSLRNELATFACLPVAGA